jgi:hypothetical protein
LFDATGIVEEWYDIVKDVGDVVARSVLDTLINFPVTVIAKNKTLEIILQGFFLFTSPSASRTG